jgi:hypothetical protein
MSGRLPAIGFRQMDRALRRLGFEPIRQKALVRAILGDIRITPEDFRAALEG